MSEPKVIGPGQALHIEPPRNIEAVLTQRLEESADLFLGAVRNANSWAIQGRTDLVVESIQCVQRQLKKLALQVGQLRTEMRLRGVWVEEGQG